MFKFIFPAVVSLAMLASCGDSGSGEASAESADAKTEANAGCDGENCAKECCKDKAACDGEHCEKACCADKAEHTCGEECKDGCTHAKAHACGDECKDGCVAHAEGADKADDHGHQ